MTGLLVRGMVAILVAKGYTFIKKTVFFRQQASLYFKYVFHKNVLFHWAMQQIDSLVNFRNLEKLDIFK